MAVIRKWSGDGLAAGAATTASVGTGDNAFGQVDAGINVTADGSRSPRLTWPDTAGTLQCRWSSLSLTDCAIRRYWTITGAPSASFYLGSLRNTSNAALIDVIMTSSGKLRIKITGDATNYDSATAISLTAGTLFRVEAVREGTTFTVYAYAGHSTVVATSISATVPSTTVGAVWWGQPSSIAVPGLTADDLAVGDTASLIGPSVIVTPPPADAIIRSWSGDGLAAGAATTASVGTGDHAFDLVDAGINVTADGSRPPRLTWPDTAGTQQVRWSGLTLTDLCLRRYWSVTGTPTATFYLANFRNTGNGTLIDVIMSSAGKLRIRAASTNYDSTATISITAGQKYRMECVRSGGTMTAYLYLGDSDTAAATISATVPADTVGAVWIGQPSSIAVPGLTADDIALSQQPQLIGPVSAEVPPDPGDGSGDQTRRIAIIGDSLTYQNGAGESNIRNMLVGKGWFAPNVWTYSCSGKGIDWRDSNNRLTTEDIAQARADLGHEPDVWVIALGTNGASGATSSTVNSILSTIGSVGTPGRIIWVGLGDEFATAKYQTFNTMADPLVAATPSGVFLDYQTFASTLSPSLWNSDGLHMPPAGYVERNTFVADGIGAPAATTPPDPGSTTIRKWGGAGLAAGPATVASVGTGDNAFDQVDTGIIISATGQRAPRLLWPDTANALQVRWSGLALHDSAYRRYWTVSGPLVDSFRLASLRTTGNATLIDIWLTTSGKLRIKTVNDVTNYDSATITIVPGTLYRTEFARTGATMTAYMYLAHSTVPFASVSATVATDTVGAVWWGQLSALTIPGLTADDLAVGNTGDLIGPIRKAWFRWNGTAWIRQIVHHAPAADPFGTPVFADQFATLNASSWFTYNGTNFSSAAGQQQAYMAANVTAGAGSSGSTGGTSLKLQANRESKTIGGTTYQFTAGMLDSKTAGKFFPRYGRFEFRAKVPHGQGLWPAVWLTAKNGGATTAEFDIVEYFHAQLPGRNSVTLHGTDASGVFHANRYTNNGASGASPRTFFEEPTLTPGWHTWMAEIIPLTSATGTVADPAQPSGFVRFRVFLDGVKVVEFVDTSASWWTANGGTADEFWQLYLQGSQIGGDWVGEVDDPLGYSSRRDACLISGTPPNMCAITSSGHQVIRAQFGAPSSVLELDYVKVWEL